MHSSTVPPPWFAEKFRELCPRLDHSRRHDPARAASIAWRVITTSAWRLGEIIVPTNRATRVLTRDDFLDGIGLEDLELRILTAYDLRGLPLLQLEHALNLGRIIDVLGVMTREATGPTRYPRTFPGVWEYHGQRHATTISPSFVIVGADNGRGLFPLWRQIVIPPPSEERPDVEMIAGQALDATLHVRSEARKLIGRNIPVLAETHRAALPDPAAGVLASAPTAMFDVASVRERLMDSGVPYVATMLVDADNQHGDVPGYVLDTAPIVRDRFGIMRSVGGPAILRESGVADALLYGTDPTLEPFRGTIPSLCQEDRLEYLPGGIAVRTSRGTRPIGVAVARSGVGDRLHHEVGATPLATNISIETLRGEQTLAALTHLMTTGEVVQALKDCGRRWNHVAAKESVTPRDGDIRRYTVATALAYNAHLLDRFA